jgi:hypothetical protein
MDPRDDTNPVDVPHCPERDDSRDCQDGIRDDRVFAGLILRTNEYSKVDDSKSTGGKPGQHRSSEGFRALKFTVWEETARYRGRTRSPTFHMSKR